MDCPGCHYTSPDDAAFCGECGAPLPRTIECPECGQPAEPAQKFCHSCGTSLRATPAAAGARAPIDYTPQHIAEKILRSKSAVEGERKRLTVLFVDIASSMRLQEERDPEAWHLVMDRFFAILTEGVHRFEGTVNQYTGDGIMGLFGAPIAHEDHAQRACYAALWLQNEVRAYTDELRLSQGLNVSVRMGLNSGEVIVGKIGDDLRMDYTAQGHTVGLAQRMEQLAESGRTYLSEHTAQLVDGYFTLRDLGAMEVKGASKPLHVHELEGPGPMKTRLDLSRARGLTRFVGRVDERAQLDRALEDVTGGAGRVIGVVADAGAGKSRLCFEFLEVARAKGIRVTQAHGVAHGKALPFLPVVELLRDSFEIDEGDSPRIARNKLAGALLQLDTGLSEALPLLFEFLGVPDSHRPAPTLEPEERQQLLFSVARRVIAARGELEPVIILFEDLHWIDAATEAFIENLVDALHGSRTLLLLNYRPEYSASWMAHSHYQQIPLRPLGEAEIRELLAALLGSGEGMDTLAARIRERTAGNPFFIEEVIWGLAEEGHLVGERGSYLLADEIAEIGVPATVEAVLAARIDRLADPEKHLLQAASVIGRSFRESVVRELLELDTRDASERLRRLCAAEFVYESAPYPETEYSFKHALTETVAYHSQLEERRAALHQRVAAILTRAEEEQLDRDAGTIARHFELGHDPASAVAWISRLGQRVGPADPVQGLALQSHVLELMRNLPDTPENLAQRVRTSGIFAFTSARLDGADPALEAALAAGRELLPRCPPGGAVDYLTFAASAAWTIGRLEEAGRLSEELIEFANRHQVGLGGARTVRMMYLIAIGRLHEAIEVGDAAQTTADPDSPSIVERSGMLTTQLFAVRASALAQLGRFEDAHVSLDRAFEYIASDIRLRGIAYMGGVVGMQLAALEGDIGGAVALGERGIDQVSGVGSRAGRCMVAANLGWAYATAGRLADARGCCEQVLELTREFRTGLAYESFAGAGLAYVSLAEGDPEAALRVCDAAIGVAQGYVFEASVAHLVRVHVLAALGEFEEAEASLARAAAFVRDMEARALEPFLHEARARLALARGDEPAALEACRAAAAGFAELGATGHVARFSALSG